MIGDRMLKSFRAIVRAFFVEEGLDLSGVFAYTIKAVRGSMPDVKIDCVPNSDLRGLPDLVGIDVKPGVMGISSLPVNGSTCYVAFVDRDPAQPIIMGGSASGSTPVARTGDAVMMFLPPALAVVGTVSGNPFAGTITVANPISGIIQGGSARVSAAS